jgi:hypothetical protein
MPKLFINHLALLVNHPFEGMGNSILVPDKLIIGKLLFTELFRGLQYVHNQKGNSIL